MTDHTHDDLRRIFDLVLSAPAAERGNVLARACPDDAAMVRRIEAMVAAAEDDRFLGAPTASTLPPGGAPPVVGAPLAAGIAATVSAVIGEGPGTHIGPYKLLELIGEGGFGSVFMAEQQSPVVRKVALKIIKLGMDTRQVIARFEAERQALAMMDHPSIARIYDAGATEVGRPYFVMELCTGEPIATYCDRNRLSIEERLDLFTQVCHAVQHAHTKGIIHRDLKPSNILVSTADDRAVAKVIDFGIAKATDSKLTQKTLFTEHRQLIGTPEYMSPEQAEGSLDIDTRTDIYALGVLLYELLTGATPFSDRDLRSAAYGEIQRIIREVDPPNPSTRLSRSRDRLGTVAAARRSEPRKLGSVLRGDLDWIVMKALEKRRARRYETASSFAADIERYLAGEAVLAAPPGAAYQLRKFANRHRGPVLAGTAVVGALLIGVIAFAWQAHIAGDQRDRAVQAEDIAQRRADELQKVSDFQSQMLSQVDAAAAGLRLTVDVRERLEAAFVRAGASETDVATQSEAFMSGWARLNATDIALQLIDSTILSPALTEIDRQFADQPALNATLRGAVADRYLDLGLVDSAWDTSQEVLKILGSAHGDDHPDTISAQLRHWKIQSFRGKYAESESALRGLIAAHQETLGADHPHMLTAANQLGVTFANQGRYEEAETVFRGALEGRRRTAGDDHALTMLALSNVADTLREQGRYAEAEPLDREAMEGRRRLLGDDHPDTIMSAQNMSVLLLHQGKLAEAEELGSRVVESARRVLGELHPTTLVTIGNLASMKSRNGKTDEAERLQRDVLTLSRSVRGNDHPNTLNAMSGLAVFLIEEGRFEDAEPLARQSLDAHVRILGRNHPSTLVSYNVMGFLMQRQNRPAEAIVYLREAFDASLVVMGEDHPDRLVLLINMGTLSSRLERPDDAETYFREAIERVTRTLGEDHPYLPPTVRSLSELLAQQQRHDEVIELLSGAETAFRRAAEIRDSGALAILLLNLGQARTAEQHFPAAADNLTEAYRRFSGAMEATSPRVQQSARAIVALFTAWHAADPHAGHDAQIAEWEHKLQQATPAAADDADDAAANPAPGNSN